MANKGGPDGDMDRDCTFTTLGIWRYMEVQWVEVYGDGHVGSQTKTVFAKYLQS